MSGQELAELGRVCMCGGDGVGMPLVSFFSVAPWSGTSPHTHEDSKDIREIIHNLHAIPFQALQAKIVELLIRCDQEDVLAHRCGLLIRQDRKLRSTSLDSCEFRKSHKSQYWKGSIATIGGLHLFWIATRMRRWY